MALYNVTEILVRHTLDTDAMTHLRNCGCDRCSDDIIAITLNKLPVRYVASSQGIAMVKAQFMDNQAQSDITRELTMAITRVNQSPHHADEQ